MRIGRIPIPDRLRRRSERQYLIVRAWNRRRALKSVVNRTGQIRKGDILAFVTLRNERVRLPFFLDYYRKLGVDHFLFINNNSDDGSGNYLAEQPDVSLWWTNAATSGRGSAWTGSTGC